MLISVIFDFDGVIVDSEPLHYRALQKEKLRLCPALLS
jgi:beta-phosphoglucomutase-like phosphatase (HAD superfamily)